MKLNEDKTVFTLEHAKIFYQTYAEILAEIHAPNIEVTAKVREQIKAKEGRRWKKKKIII